MAARRLDIKKCLDYLFCRVETQELLDYLVGTGLKRDDFLQVVSYLEQNPKLAVGSKHLRNVVGLTIEELRQIRQVEEEESG